MLPQLSVEKIIPIIRKCRQNKELALFLYSRLRISGLEAHSSLGDHIVTMLVEAKTVFLARDVFDKLTHRSESSWNCLLKNYIRTGQLGHAFRFYDMMQQRSVDPDDYTFVLLLQACSKLNDPMLGIKIHHHVDRLGLINNNCFVGTALVDMYVKCGKLQEAQQVFDRLPSQEDVISWNALIAGYVQNEQAEQALSTFEEMRLRGVSPDVATLSCVVKACGNLCDINKGEDIASDIERRGFLNHNLVIGNALIDMYAKFGFLLKAQNVFDKLPSHNVISWTTLIAGCVEHGYGEEALHYFEEMQFQGVSPDPFAFACSLQACAITISLFKGHILHSEIEQRGLFGKDPIIGTALIDMYAKCDSLAEAESVFNKLPVKNLIVWTALITGYVQHEYGEKAIKCFEEMKKQGIVPDSVTLACVFKACGIIGASDKGEELHSHAKQEGEEINKLVGNALIDMYAKCGMMKVAQEVFDSLPLRDVITWNSLLTGYSQLGEIECVLYIFQRMKEKVVEVNAITLTAVLNACSHAGYIDLCLAFFKILTADHGIFTNLEHYTCIADVFGRSGQLNMAMAVLNQAPLHPNVVMSVSMLGACCKWGNTELAAHVFEHAIGLDENDTGIYISMFNIYDDSSMHKSYDAF